MISTPAGDARHLARLIPVPAECEIYYISKPASHEFILGFSAIGERTIREALQRIAVTYLTAWPDVRSAATMTG